MKYIKEFIKWFIIINTGVLLIFIINTMQYDYIRTIYLREIFAVSGVTSLITTVFFAIDPRKILTKFVQIVIVFLHYVSLFITMLLFGNSFGWISFNLSGVLTMALSVAGVYICTAVLSVVTEMQDARRMNEALDKFRHNEPQGRD